MSRARALVPLILLLAAAAPAVALVPDASGLGRGGTYTAFALGAPALWSNPSTLNDGLVSAGLGFGLDAGNNAMSLNRMVGIVTGGQTGKDNAIADVTKHKADTGENWAALIEGGAGLGASVEGIAIGVSPEVRLSADNVTPDMMAYALNQSIPLVAGKAYDIEGNFAEQTFERVSVGYAMKVPIPIPLVSFMAGAQLTYLNGTDLSFTMMNEKFTAGPGPVPSADSTYAKATSGRGFTGDVGISMKALAGMLKAAVVVKDIGAKITWDGDVHHGAFDPSTLTYVYTDQQQNLSIKLPTRLIVAVGGQVPAVGTAVGAEVEVIGLNGKDDLTAVPTNTRIHVGAEQKILGVLGFRLGYESKADPIPQQVTAGLMIGAIVARLDLGVGMALDGKGGSAGLSAQVAL